MHQGADEIVSDPVHGQLFENNIRFETAQYIHAKHGFDLSQVQFDVPAPEVEFFQFMENVARGGEELENLFLSETRTERLGDLLPPGPTIMVL